MLTTLVLDGGGVRGIFSVHILKYLATAIHGDLNDKVDLIVGVSVGGLIGAMLATGMLDDKSIDIKQLINDNFADIFRSRTDIGPLLAPKYDGKGKSRTLKRIFGDLKMGDVQTPLAIVCSTVKGVPRIFKSYDKEDADLYIYEVIDATSAAPVIFPPVLIDKTFYIDGGVVSNVPLVIAFIESIKTFGGDRSNIPFNMISVGTRATREVEMTTKLALDMGLVTWLSVGLIDVLTGVGDDTSEQLMKMLLGDERFKRIVCEDVECELDDMHVIDKLITSAAYAWSKHGDGLISMTVGDN
jgi:predicted acylesterase/phospholipase RssA